VVVVVVSIIPKAETASSLLSGTIYKIDKDVL
jgi:hypothetical protein